MELLKIIKKLSKRYRLSGGNCGTFSCALALLLIKNNPEIMVITDAEEEDDLWYGEPNVFHVVVKIKDKYYDQDGIHKNLDSIVDWIEEEYDPYVLDSYTFPKEEWNQSKFFTMIRSQTNYDIDIPFFLSKLKTLVKNEK